jgi:hypothetical protein
MALHSTGSKPSTSTRKNSDELDDLLATVSEAEALLACRPYLLRRNRLGEQNLNQQRRAKRIEMLDQAKGSDSTDGFFRPDPLKVVRANSDPQWMSRFQQESTSTSNAAAVVVDTSDKDVVLPDASSPLSASFGTKKRRKRRRLEAVEPIIADTAQLVQQRLSGVWENVDVILAPEDETSSASTYFQIDEDSPSSRFKRRSDMQRKKFADPVWKAAWYERRWGNHRRLSEREKNERLLHKRVLPLARLLSHPALAAMNEDEIANAIRTYRNANLQRSANGRLAIERRRNDFEFPAGTEFTINATMVSRHSLYSVDQQDLDKVRAKRAEVGRRAYETRHLRAQAKKDTPLLLDSTTDPIEGTGPHVAWQRISNRLLEPSTAMDDPAVVEQLREDLKEVMIPVRLSRRKNLLRRMLSDFFNMRGKCIPHGESGGYAFATNAPIEDLASVLDGKLTSRLHELSDKSR